MTVLTDVQTTVATVKSAFASKTNWAGAIIAVLSLLATLGVLAPEHVAAITTAGGVLVVAFRTFSKSVIAAGQSVGKPAVS